MTGIGKFFSDEGFFSISDAFGGRADLLWASALGDLILGLSLLSIFFIGLVLSKKIKARTPGLLVVLGAFVLILAVASLTSALLLWEPLYWLSALLKITVAAVAVIATIWIAQAWPQIVAFGVLARKFEGYHDRIEKRHSRALFSYASFEQLLNRSVFMPIALSLVLIVVFTTQISYLVNVKGEVAEATKRISFMHALQGLYVDAESGLRGYLLTGKPEFLQPFEQAKLKAPRLLNDLLRQTATEPLLQQNFQKLGENFVEWVDIANPLIERRARGLPYRDTSVESYHRELTNQSRVLFSEAIRLTVTKRDAFSHSADQATHLFILISVTLSALIGVALALWSRRQILTLSRSYSKALETARELNTHLENRVSERTADLAAANQALATANSELEAFSYSVSHDLRGPLRGIDGFSQILMEDEGDKLSPSSQKHLHFIRDGVRKMGNLIDDLLNLSRIAKTELISVPVNAASIAIEIGRKLRQQSPERNVQIEVDPMIAVQADPSLLRIVLENLLGNAWKFSRQKTQSRIQVRAVTEPGFTGFRVIDNGAGFDMNFQSKLFNAFQRLHTAREFEGTGIGLALCRRIVLRHGGYISANGTLGEGAEFKVLFPGNPKIELRDKAPERPQADANL